MFMPEYKAAFLHSHIDGCKLTELSTEDWKILGIKKGHLHLIKNILSKT